MRVRKKKNTDKRLEACSDILLDTDPTLMTDIKEIFNDDNQLQIEIGCGKGGFVSQMAEKNPTVNFIAIEKIREVIVSAAEKVKSLNLLNVKLLNIDAKLLAIKLPPKSVSTIYLNFSDPWTKNRNVNRRLTDKGFLEIYKIILKDNGTLIQKTDNRELFEFSLKSLVANGFTVVFSTYDLHSEPDNNNVITEYEQKFINEGKPIHKLIATKN
ncbi:MAG: tRNA (guanosine(46)-N7)-methyltransferase TrmB [Clostridia bacterium]